MNSPSDSSIVANVLDQLFKLNQGWKPTRAEIILAKKSGKQHT